MGTKRHRSHHRGLEQAVWKKNPHTWGRNSLVILGEWITVSVVWKKNPHTWGRNFFVSSHNVPPFSPVWKKNPHTWGRKLSSHSLFCGHSQHGEKRIPIHGDENLTSRIFSSKQVLWKKNPHTWGRKRADVTVWIDEVAMWKKNPQTWGRKRERLSKLNR